MRRSTGWAGFLGAGLWLVPAAACGGAWTQEPGTAYVRVTTGYLASSERFDGSGDRVPWDSSGGGFRNSEYQDLAMALYTEVGFAPGFNAVAYVPWSRIQAEQPTAVFTTYGVGDIFVALKRRLWAGPATVSSVLAGLSFPGGYDELEYPALGSGVVEASVLLQVGHSWSGPWGNLEGEFRFRGGDYAHQLRGAVGGGFPLGRRLSLRGEARGALALDAESGGGADQTPGTDPDLPFDPATADPSYLDVAGTVSFALLRGVALEGEVRGTLRGENTLAGVRWSIAVATSPSWRYRSVEP